MSRKLQQPVGQKRLTNVAVVRLKKHGNRFEIACFKNKVLSWRSGVEKDVDEVLQSHTVFSNVSKGILAKCEHLKLAFGTDDQPKICREILEKGELQVAGKERDCQLSSQFRDIAMIVMQKTMNSETRRPYTISMIERLMHEIHFAIDPQSTSKKQALEVIRELQKHFPIKRSPMRLRLSVDQNSPLFLEKLSMWHANIVSKDESKNQISFVCEIDPGFFRECDVLVRNLHGKLEILAVCVGFEGGDTHVDDYDGEPRLCRTNSSSSSSSSSGAQPCEKAEERSVSVRVHAQAEAKQTKCSTCSVTVGDARQYRDHSKSDWHKHNLRRKSQQLPPLSAEDFLASPDLMIDPKDDRSEYSFQ